METQDLGLGLTHNSYGRGNSTLICVLPLLPLGVRHKVPRPHARHLCCCAKRRPVSVRHPAEHVVFTCLLAQCTGQTLRRRELLAHRGLTVISVPFYVWQSLPSCPSRRQQYMRERLQASALLPRS
jgi:hypothetical protein